MKDKQSPYHEKLFEIRFQNVHEEVLMNVCMTWQMFDDDVRSYICFQENNRLSIFFGDLFQTLAITPSHFL